MRINIIGGSVARAFGIEESPHDWPSILASRLHGPSNVQFAQSVGFLNPSSLLAHIEQTLECDLLVVHMGTSVGWPVIQAPVERILRPEHRHDAAFHLPTRKAVNFSHFVARLFRHSLRNTLKIIAFPFGFYRPRQSLDDLEPAIKRALSTAFSKANQVVWIQHRSLGYRRLFLERRVYRKYYDRIIDILENSIGEDSRLHLIKLPEEFLNQRNFTLDGVHLSGTGHMEIAKLIEARLQEWRMIND
jgi:hypothetical protein